MQVLALDIDGVVTDGTASLCATGVDEKRIDFHDLDAVTLARKSGIRVAFITGEDNEAVDRIATRFGVETVIRGAKDKAAAIRALAEREGVGLESICFVGDSDRDAPAMALAGLGVAPANATPAAKAAAHRILSRRGGSGAVAEVTEWILQQREADRRGTELLAEVRRIATDSLEAHRRLIDESLPVIVEVAQALTRAIRMGRKILLFGNGGSAADAQHVAGELVGRFLKESDPWPAIALTTDTSILTCIGNDWCFEDVFARQVRALAQPGDIVVGISTSGRSSNVLRALNDGRAKGAVTVGFTGPDGGPMRDAADICFCAPAPATPRVQELHLLAWHAICEIVETELMASC